MRQQCHKKYTLDLMQTCLKIDQPHLIEYLITVCHVKIFKARQQHVHELFYVLRSEQM